MREPSQASELLAAWYDSDLSATLVQIYNNKTSPCSRFWLLTIVVTTYEAS